MSALTPSERVTLRAVCDTFVPPVNGTGGPLLHERVERFIGDLPDPDDIARLTLLLRVLDSAAINLVLSGRPRRFAALDPGARTQLLRGWAESGIQLRRAGFQALKRLVNVSWYAFPSDGTRHPAWTAVGYPGPLPMPPSPAPRLSVVAVDRDTTLDCDVVVVGSGAGGGVAAGVLSAAGRDVIVLEMGENLGPADFTQIEGDMLRAGYLDGGMVMTHSGSLPILAGSCVGGGTTINWTTSIPVREPTRAEWDTLSGLSLFESAAFRDSLGRVMQASGVNTDNSVPGVRDQILERGLRACGWHVDVIPRNASGCVHGLECGYCGFGCRHNAKNSTMKTYLADAVRDGARIVPRATAQRVLREAGRAVGIEATVRTATGATVRLTVRAKAVVAACGALHTPALLRRSGIEHPLIGARLFLHPVSAVTGRFAERVEPWGGDLQTRHSEQFANQDDWYGAKFETGPVHWALPASAFGWEGPARHKDDIASLAHTSVVGILLRDREPGRVEIKRSGRPQAHYELSRYDAAHLRTAILGAASVLAAAGATEVGTLQQPPVRVATGGTGWHDEFRRRVDAIGLDRCRMALISFHQMGTVPMGMGPARGAAGPNGEVFACPGLYVADSSTFPASSGVNPMITIMAIADQVARGLI